MTALRRSGRVLAGLVLAAGSAIAMASPAAAEEVSNLSTSVEVNADTTMDLHETITYDFGSEYRHGIFRDIPVYDETASGSRRTYDVRVNDVLMDGAPVPFETSDNGPYLNLRIGDADTTISGVHTYEIDYTVGDGLRVITAEDMSDPQMPANLTAGDVELYWDLVGTGWDVPVAQASGRVVGPADVLSSTCLYGPAGSTSTCPTTADGRTAAFGPVSLGSAGALTAVAVYPAEAFTAAPRENITQGPPNPFLGVLGGLLPALLLVVVPIGIAMSRRRTDRGADAGAAPAQYSAPDGATPAELDAAWHGSVDAGNARVLVATLLDLAARRWINVGIDADSNLTVARAGTGTTPLAPWETDLLALVLKGQDLATLSGYDSDLKEGWHQSFVDLVAAAEATGRRNPDGDGPDRRWNWLMWLFLACFAIGFASIWLGPGIITAVAVTMGAGSLIGFFAARAITPRRETAQSAQFLAKTRGLRKVLGTDAAASRREFAQRSGLTTEAIFATMLPFAVVFGLENSWVGAFPDLTPEQLMGSGFYVGSVYAMTGFVDTGTTSMSSAMTAPSSGSGGGGFSGGGGGGGGGGSW